MELRKIAETNTTITLGWDPVPCIGYRFSAEKQAKPSHTWDQTRNSVKFSKGSAWYKVEALGIADAGVYPSAAPPPITWSGPITITSGGTYEGAWEATGAGQAAVTVSTTQPVTITGYVRNLAGGTLIDCLPGGAVNITVENLYAYSGPTYQTSGRFVDGYGFKSVTVRNCTIENTRGIDLAVGATSPSVLITKNRHRNIKGGPNAAPVGNFVQLRVMAFASCEISWNEVINEYDLSEPEDLVSLYYTQNVNVTDNYFQHHSRIGNLTPSSQGGITVDTSQGPGPAGSGNNHYIARNQLVDAYGIVVYVNGGGSNNLVENNRIVSDRYLPNGQLKANGAGSPLTIVPGGSNNHAHGNLVGFIDKDGTYISQAVVANYLTGAAEGGTTEAANNTYMAQASINAAAEAAEWTFWQNKLAANGITVGAP